MTEDLQYTRAEPGLGPKPEFNQHTSGGRMSPLRSPRQFEEENLILPPSQAINDYAARATPSSSHSYNITPNSRNGRKGRGQGHAKCYYEELSSVVRSRLGDLMLTVAEEEQRIER